MEHKQITPLSDKEKQAMQKIMDHFYRNGASLQARAHIMVQCAEFAVIFREQHGIEAMAAFIDWAFANDIEADEVLSTIMHDLNEQHEPYMLPRTSSYYQETNDEN